MIFICFDSIKNKSNLITICVVQGELDGELVKSRLQAEGIPAMLKFETYFNLILGTFCPVSVLVPRKYEELARKIIKSKEQTLISTIPAKNKWTFILVRLFSLFIGGK